MLSGSQKKFFTSMLLAIFLASSIGLEAFANTTRNHIEKKRKETRAKIIKLKKLESAETNKLYRNQLKLEQNQKNLSVSKSEYTNAQSRLTELQSQLSRSMAAFSYTEFKSRNRIRQIYKKQRYGLIQWIFSTKDLNQLLDRVYYQSIIAKQDKQRLAYVKARARKIAMLKAQAEEQRKILQGAVQTMRYEQASIQTAIDKNSTMIQKLRTDRKAYERSEKELARQSANLQNMIQRQSYSNDIRVTSGFIKPIAGPITSPFGWRVHPIFKSRTFHSGIDIGGRYGGPIRASNSGKVIYSGWYGGYGKVVIVDHGRYNGVRTTTLYAHLSGFAVNNGDYVSKGQVIAYEGSTGYSTGPHCHFEVRVNGQPTNPLNYI
ncbi:MAG: peptidoglycan DD-metalloendopeptidase family protein [Candidatus Gastranaerophilales bacterium]|nr:peptidoglycan DD-metalloendopeptidase family protein [Candidatus Gastranaerophilales bacterium]